MKQKPQIKNINGGVFENGNLENSENYSLP